MTVMDMMDEIAEKLPTKTKKKTKKEKEPSAEDRKIIEDAAKQREAEVIAQQARLERARINRANEPTVPQPTRPQTPVRTDAPEVGPPRPVTSQGANVNKAADDAANLDSIKNRMIAICFHSSLFMYQLTNESMKSITRISHK